MDFSEIVLHMMDDIHSLDNVRLEAAYVYINNETHVIFYVVYKQKKYRPTRRRYGLKRNCNGQHEYMRYTMNINIAKMQKCWINLFEKFSHQNNALQGIATGTSNFSRFFYCRFMAQLFLISLQSNTASCRIMILYRTYRERSYQKMFPLNKNGLEAKQNYFL